MPEKQDFSLKEAAVLAGVSEKSIRHEMARRIATPRRVSVGKATRRKFRASDLYYLRLLASLPVALTPKDRKDLYDLILHDLPEMGGWQASSDRLRLRGAVDVEIYAKKLKRDLERRIKSYLRGRKGIRSEPDVLGGEPVFAGTRIPVRHIGLLAKKEVPADQILEDYPALNEADIAFAHIFVELRPDPGRPKKRIEFRRSA